MDVRVETHCGYKADEYPVRFWIEGTGYTVLDIEDRWYSPDADHFRVLADDAATYLLRHCLSTQRWELAELRSAAPSAGGGEWAPA